MNRGHTTGDRELDLDLQTVLIEGHLPAVDLTQIRGDDLLRALCLEQRRTNALLEVLAVTTRFNRGNYDGPYMGRKRVLIRRDEVTEIFKARRYPAALRIEAAADPIGPSPTLLLSSDRGSIRGGDAYSLSTSREIRIMVAAEQSLYGSISGSGGPTSVIIVKEARL